MQVNTIDLEFKGRPGLIASFLLESAGTLALIEPGPESTRETLLKRIAELGHHPDMIRDVFITHAHLDHAGSGGWWARLGATLHVHPKAARHIIEPTKLVNSAKSVFGEAFDSLWGEMLPAPEDRVNILEDCATVAIGDLTIEAIDTPGHCFHHHAFAIGDHLFAGDIVGACLGDSEYISVTSAPPQFHLESYLNSIERIEARHFSKLHLTHFGEVDDVDVHLAKYRAAVIGAAEIVKALIADGNDAESIQVAYQAFQMEQAFKAGLPRDLWDDYQASNNTDMCADGLRMYWERGEVSPTS